MRSRFDEQLSLLNKKMIEKKRVINFIPKRIYYYNDRYYLIGFNENKEKRITKAVDIK